MDLTAKNKYYWLRWRFEYSDGKPPVYGQWGRQGEKNTQAWCTDKNNLLYACIEAKDLIQKTVSVVAAVKGEDFLNFSWKARKSLFGGNTEVIGLEILSRDEIVTVLVDGRAFKEPRPKDDYNFHYEGFGK